MGERGGYRKGMKERHSDTFLLMAEIGKRQRIKDGVRFAIILVLTVALIFSWMFFLCRHNNETGTNSDTDDKKEEIRSAVMLYEDNPTALPQHGGNDSCMRICRHSQLRKKSA